MCKQLLDLIFQSQTQTQGLCPVGRQTQSRSDYHRTQTPRHVGTSGKILKHCLLSTTIAAVIYLSSLIVDSGCALDSLSMPVTYTSVRHSR